ncbi:hypothetical protein GCM10009785_00610 [Brooklawnia cerclae]|uniref:Transaldolase n=1 Tax=Brooklawnia cerclae TaxID=349934 RepID=A0ABX0SD74_9ACTN|nr:transaldolase family protein [Brooklawnia cerclae]NIH56345.1 hypothetical protein [Brooklawnia cerclae]
MPYDPLTPPLNLYVRSLGLQPARGVSDHLTRVLDKRLDPVELSIIAERATYIGVTDEFARICDYFKPADGHTPAGFRFEYDLEPDGLLNVNLVRDISYDSDGRKRPTNVIYSADSANPYEVEPIAPLLGNLTCNPGIIYDLFINNDKANVGHKFSTRDEVMAELGRILGPGVDISVELNNPFEPDFNKILEEAAFFKEMLSEWRVVIKVPHTGPVNADNVGQLLEGNGRLDTRYWEPGTADALRGHNLALKLHEAGYRINYTLMFEPYQTQMALQARPYFINSFIRHRLVQSRKFVELLDRIDAGDADAKVQLRDYMLSTDYLSGADEGFDPDQAVEKARTVVEYRHIEDDEGSDGLDGVRHNLRVLRNANLPDTRLIICSMEGDQNYPDIDRLLASEEFEDMADRVVVTAEPSYLARFTSTNQVVSYQRRFMKAAQGEK